MSRPPSSPPGRPPLEEVLRQALNARAEQVEPAPDALSSIRRRVAVRTRQRRTITIGLASLATGAVASITAVMVGLSSCLPPPTGPNPLGTGSVSVAPSSSPSTPPSPASLRLNLPVYYVRDVGGTPLLYREFTPTTVVGPGLSRVPGLPERLVAGVDVMLHGAALDPDYASPWPASAAVWSVTINGDVAVVDIAGATTNQIDQAGARMAVQQLIWTVTAIASDAKAPVAGVQLLFDGQPRTTLWGSAAVAGTLVRAAEIETLAPLWLIAPQQEDVVGRSFEVFINGAVYEASARLRIRDPSGTVVVDQHVQLSAGGPQRGEARFTMTLPATLPAGRYTIETFYYAEPDGHIAGMDDHEITVR